MRKGRMAAALAAACTLIGAGPAGAHGLDDEALMAAGPSAVKQANGLIRIKFIDGTTATTHGPDPVASHSIEMEAGNPERRPFCVNSGYRTHVLYAHPPAVDRYSTVKAELQSIMKRANYILDEEGRKSGDRTADYALACDSLSHVRVDSVTVAAGSSYEQIVNAAKLASYKDPVANYTVFFDGGDADDCGLGTVEADDRASTANLNNSGGAYAVIYKRCWGVNATMHEMGHNQGAVQNSAPHSTGAGHCNENRDVMCYVDKGPRNQTMVDRCMSTVRFDCGYDDYFDTTTVVGSYLNTHWNLGSPYNRFMRFGTPPAPAIRGDFTGDRTADIAIWRPSTGNWHVRGDNTPTQFGWPEDLPAAADYSGYGRLDMGTFRPSSLLFQAAYVTPGLSPGYPLETDIPVSADYDGDGLADFATYGAEDRTWVIHGITVKEGVAYGQAWDIPVPGDYDGDGDDEKAVFRPSTRTWYASGSLPGEGIAYGTQGDIPVPADYNGDGKLDLAVFRPSNRSWYIRGVTDSLGIAWGASTDVPVPADYTGDGKADIAVFRPSDGTWHIRGVTAAGSPIQYGQNGDIPVSGPIVIRPIMERAKLL